MAAPPVHPNDASEPFGPWNPGITSQLTPELWRMCTIFRPENVFTTYDQAVEFRDLTGFPLPHLVVWRPERIVLHDVLMRVIADYEVPDPEGADVPSLGVNFRRMTRAILRHHLSPRMDLLIRDYAPAREAIAKVVANELAIAFDRPSRTLQEPKVPRRPHLLGWLHRAPPTPTDEEPSVREDRLIDLWRSKSHGDAMAAATYGALTRVISAIRGLHGELWGSPDVLEPLITGLACNVHGAELIAHRVGPLIAEAAVAEHFRPLPPQTAPIAMSTKGTSAAGKSTMRPMLRSLAARMGASWSDFALISPDIFRRDLPDIDSLGRHYKYFGTFTSHELEVVDRKLDRYLEQKVELNTLPHLLVDRFRFDSFAPDSEEQRKLIARLGMRRLVYYLFMITPPEKTVERAWNRALVVGRYKPLDDLLAHNVDAYAGMQSFFLARVLRPASRNQHYEFVDNDVPVGEVPPTVAFGSHAEFNIVDVKRVADMDRYCKINVDAHRPEDLYMRPRLLAIENNVAFLRTCVRELPVLNFAHRDTGRVYARFERGRLAWKDQAALDAIEDPVTHAALNAVAPEMFVRVSTSAIESARYLDPATSVTLGRWGGAMSRGTSGDAF
jgi:hypothetical protein